MTNAPQATAAPAEVKLAGQTYRMSPLADEDFGELERHLQTRAMEVAKKNLDGLSPEDRQTVLREAYQTAYKITVNSPQAVEYMRGLEGAAYLLWLGLRHNHPELTPAAIRKMLTDERTIMEAMDRLDELNGTGPAEDVKKKVTPPPTRAQKNRRKRSGNGPLTAAPSTGFSPSVTAGTPTQLNA